MAQSVRLIEYDEAFALEREEEGGWVTLEAAEEGRAYSSDYTEVCIEGGNHAGFGLYGPQAGDGVASISKEEQWRLTADTIEEWK